MNDADLRDLRRRALDDPEAARRLAQEIVRTHGFMICRRCLAFVPEPEADDHLSRCEVVARAELEQAGIEELVADAGLRKLRAQPYYDRQFANGYHGSENETFFTNFTSFNQPVGLTKRWGVDTNSPGLQTGMYLLATKLEVIPDPCHPDGRKVDADALDQFFSRSMFMLRSSQTEEVVIPGVLARRGFPLTVGKRPLLLGEDNWQVMANWHTPGPWPFWPGEEGATALGLLVVIHGVWVTRAFH